MSPKPLIAEVVFGRELTESTLLASHPDERKLPNGRPSLTRRTIAMQFDGRRFTHAVSLSFAIHRGWSSANGTGYCTPIRGNVAHVCVKGQWQTEPFSKQEEKVLRIWGISGKTPKDDLVYISTDGALFVRRQGTWGRHEPPEPGRLYGVYGHAPDEVYVCSDTGLLLWSGNRLTEIEDQPPVLVKVVVVSGEEIFAGDRELLHWDSKGWRRVEPKVPEPTALVEIDGTVIVGTFAKGVMERKDGAFVRATPDFMCLEVQQIGSGAFAKGDDQSYVRLTAQWQRLPMPECPAGELPKLI